MNNCSLFTADRMTHLKIVVVSLACATLAAGIGVAARVSEGAAPARMEATIMKPAKPMTAANAEELTIR